MRMMNPSVMVSRLDLVVLDSAAVGIDFVDSPRVSGILGYLYSKEAVRGAPEAGAPWWAVLSLEHPPGAALAH